jgi:hypothetical protein
MHKPHACRMQQLQLEGGAMAACAELQATYSYVYEVYQLHCIRCMYVESSSCYDAGESRGLRRVYVCVRR